MTTLNTHTNPSSSTRSFSEHKDAIKDDVQNLREDATAAATDAVQAVAQTAKQSVETVTDLATTGGEKAGEYHDAVCRVVRKHPTAAVVGAIGVGIMLGKVFGR